jgi:hypothetical protein
MAILLPRSRRWVQEAAYDRFLTQHLSVSFAKRPDSCNLSSLTNLCGLPPSVEKYKAPNEHLRCKRSQRFGQKQRNCHCVSKLIACEDVYQLETQLQISRSRAAYSEKITIQAIVFVVCGRKQTQLLQIEHKGSQPNGWGLEVSGCTESEV